MAAHVSALASVVTAGAGVGVGAVPAQAAKRLAAANKSTPANNRLSMLLLLENTTQRVLFC
jgi:hypothetical protein